MSVRWSFDYFQQYVSEVCVSLSIHSLWIYTSNVRGVAEKEMHGLHCPCVCVRLRLVCMHAYAFCLLEWCGYINATRHCLILEHWYWFIVRKPPAWSIRGTPLQCFDWPWIVLVDEDGDEVTCIDSGGLEVRVVAKAQNPSSNRKMFVGAHRLLHCQWFKLDCVLLIPFGFTRINPLPYT